MNSPSWHKDAACKGMNPELFFLTRGESSKAAKAVCATCPVRQPCYDAGVDEDFGIWGGVTRKERQMAEKGHTNGRIRVRGCWRCGMPVNGNDHYCSDDCRAEARRANNRKYHQKMLLNREAAS